MSENLPDLPQEVISDILVRLPAKSIGRSRCVSKPWLSLLTSYGFIKAHLAHHTHSLAQQQNLLLCSSTGSIFTLTLHLGGNHLRMFVHEQVRALVGSCNGLLLVETAFNVLWLMNCLTNEYVKLPDLPFPLKGHTRFRMLYGFGYDSISDEFKIVSISPEFVDIYCLKMRTWRRSRTSPYGNTLKVTYGVFVNGALHWIAWKSSDKESVVIIAFDLSSEEFKEFPAPPASIDIINIRKLMVIDGCLGIVVELIPGVYSEIWLMKSYSMVESWTKLVIDMEFTRYWYPHCFHEDKLLFSESDLILKWYHLQDGRVEVCLLTDDSHRYNFLDGITYSQSLVSPHFNYQN